MKALVLCGGFGMRLRPAIGETQKSVAPIGSTPFLQIVASHLEKAGMDDVIYCAHYRADQVMDVVGAHCSVIVEPTPLGTGGAVLHAIDVLGLRGPFIVLNADTHLDPSAYSLAAQGPYPSVVAMQTGDRSRYGALQVDAEGRVISTSEKGLTGPGLVSVGVYGFDTAFFRNTPRGVLSIEYNFLPRFVEQGILQCRLYDGHFLDIGTPDSLAMMRKIYPKARQ
jgi:NDP-sugar pyrophosphorylase family protein